jgi:hypothetical protein
MSDNDSRYILVAGTPYTLESVEAYQKAVAAMAEAGAETADVYSDGEPTGETVELDYDPKVVALATHLDCSPLDVSECRYGDNQYESTEDPGEYLVLTDSEADDAWDASLESYIDDCLLVEVPDGLATTLARYFDREAWKRDARHDGRGHSLNSYNGREDYEKVGGTGYYIYRVN